MEGWHMVHSDETVHQYFTNACAVEDCESPLQPDMLATFRALTWDFFVEIPLCEFHIGFVTASADILTPAD